MDFSRSSAPFIWLSNPIQTVMGRVLLAMLPGIAVLMWLFGTGVLVQLGIASLTVLLVEALCLWLRDRPVWRGLSDGSALLSGWLLAVSLPPLLPWWMTVLGCGFAIVVAKQLYGGLGQNPFNPAMVGYVVLLVSFPLAMSSWVLPGQGPGIIEATAMILGQMPISDGLTGATLLDSLRTARVQGIRFDSLGLGWLGGSGWEWINLAFLSGGLWLLWRGTADWRIPTALLASLGLLSSLGFLLAPEHFQGPLVNLFSGATMLGAFFIATDPVSASTTPRGRWIYGCGIGLLIWVIRSLGGYPDGVAFAVLLMNISSPTLDQLTRPRVLGEP